MIDSSPATVLVGVDLWDPLFPHLLLRMLSAFDGILLGGEVPDQTASEQARQEFEEEARGALESVQASFEEEGIQAVRKFLPPIFSLR